MAESYTFTVTGIPRTKKTSNRIVKAGEHFKVLPSTAWVWWCENAIIIPKGKLPGRMEQNFNVTALFYRDANRGDSHGFYQGLADLLEKRGVIANDRQLVSWDGSRLLKDRDNPRTEVTLTTTETP